MNEQDTLNGAQAQAAAEPNGTDPVENAPAAATAARDESTGARTDEVIDATVVGALTDDDAVAAADVADDTDDADDADDDADADGDDADGDPLDTEGEIAADYLEELLDIADLDGDIDTYVESGRAHVSVVTDATVLVGEDGKVLEALQELARLAVVTETGHRSRLMLDIAGHRDKRRQELLDLATDAIQEAKSSKEQVRLSPMNPFERKIVHDAVAAAGLTSESEGEEPRRRVVVTP